MIRIITIIIIIIIINIIIIIVIIIIIIMCQQSDNCSTQEIPSSVSCWCNCSCSCWLVCDVSFRRCSLQSRSSSVIHSSTHWVRFWSESQRINNSFGNSRSMNDHEKNSCINSLNWFKGSTCKSRALACSAMLLAAVWLCWSAQWSTDCMHSGRDRLHPALQFIRNQMNTDHNHKQSYNQRIKYHT